MGKTIIFLLLISSSNLIFSQEIFTEIQGKKIDYFITIEKNLKSELFDTNQNYISLDDSAQPLIYKRKEKNIPDLLVQYFFSKKDSIINEILYEWDVNNFEKKDNNVKPEKFNKALIEKYKTLLKTLNNKYGESKSEGNLDNFKEIDTNKGLKRNDSWSPSDSLEIEMYTTISNYYKKEGFATTNPTHKIRLYVRNIKKKIEPKFDENVISIANQNFENFISKLKQNNISESKLFLSEIVLKNITDNQLIGLQKSINFENKLIPFSRGFQTTLTGETYLMVQYKYNNELNEVPLSIIKVIFDTENKILGIQPLQRNKLSNN
ncbi:hypothetical protein J2Y38_001015 [Flavobacterium sp. 2755]|uniref:hypothetical protein n=1 Tax=Flavobacterium sp. 2755 TaxID=2817765 RepID=UPI00285901C8|nr:hypothetical protein [Flavobacterium sp. 2755]MDR6760817.1 hypothetical protein [Flavobacterium sp. 2755]